MPAIGTPTLDQLRVFLAVAEAGSFSAAGRQLNRQQSVVSYTIANLEQQLGGLLLFDRSKRRPVLTEAGHTILAEARKLTMGADGLRACSTNQGPIRCFVADRVAWLSSNVHRGHGWAGSARPRHGERGVSARPRGSRATSTWTAPSRAGTPATPGGPRPRTS